MVIRWWFKTTYISNVQWAESFIWKQETHCMHVETLLLVWHYIIKCVYIIFMQSKKHIDFLASSLRKRKEEKDECFALNVKWKIVLSLSTVA